MKSYNILNGGLTSSNTSKTKYNSNTNKSTKFVYPAEKLKDFKAKKHG